ncbi:transcriptional regulator GutM [Thermoanaerobacterium sp. DL9XJH110]|uniref:transcriptional regulator GutM n=1 Tax=Thermoanaerobacterium sp. DL9XJH110 TaxID=3386643 RepID=UPI003BB4B300
MIYYIIALLGISWVFQSLLTYRQVKHFNERFHTLRKLGKVIIGKSRGGVFAGVVLLLAIDDKCNVIRAERMMGISVFARMKDLKELENENLLQFDRNKFKCFDKLTQKALENAICNLKNSLGMNTAL